jgi:hypothetical protein
LTWLVDSLLAYARTLPPGFNLRLTRAETGTTTSAHLYGSGGIFGRITMRELADGVTELEYWQTEGQEPQFAAFADGWNRHLQADLQRLREIGGSQDRRAVGNVLDQQVAEYEQARAEGRETETPGEFDKRLAGVTNLTPRYIEQMRYRYRKSHKKE